MSFVSFASSAALWTPLHCRQHTCTISNLYGVTDIHSKEAHTTLQILTEILNTLMIGHLAVMIIFLVTRALNTYL
jgi:hypothetical protein